MVNNDITKLIGLGFRKGNNRRYYLLAPGNSYVVLNSDRGKYRLEIDGNRIGTKDLSIESVETIISILYT